MFDLCVEPVLRRSTGTAINAQIYSNDGRLLNKLELLQLNGGGALAPSKDGAIVHSSGAPPSSRCEPNINDL